MLKCLTHTIKIVKESLLWKHNINLNIVFLLTCANKKWAIKLGGAGAAYRCNPCINSLGSISGVCKLIHLSACFPSNYTSVKCHLSRLSLTRVMSSSQPLQQPKWSLHCLEPAGSGWGMEDWAGSPQCDWKAKLMFRVLRWKRAPVQISFHM